VHPLAGVELAGLDVPLEVVVLGVLSGLTYALAAAGVVLAYRTSRVLNFAQGEMGALAAMLVPVLVLEAGLPYWVGVLAALAGAALTGVAMELVVVRKFAASSRLLALVATIGASQALFTVEAFLPKGERLATEVYPVPFSATVHVGNLSLDGGDLLVLLVAPLAAVSLAGFLRRTRVGLAARCAAENLDAARLAGVPVRRVSLQVWVVVGLLAGVSGILAGPSRPLVTQLPLGPDLLLRDLAAAMVGGLTSIPGAFAGGIAIGVVEAVAQWNAPTGGTPDLVLFLVVLVAFLVRRGLGTRVRGDEGSSWSLTAAVRPLPDALARLPRVRMARAGVAAGAIACGALLPLAADDAQRVLVASVLLFAAMGLSLVVLTGFAGQVSLGQFAFVEVGALVGGRMAELGFPTWMGVLYAVAAGVAVALVVGIPALRIRGLFLAVVTLAFAVAAQTWLFGQHWLVSVSGARSSLEIPRPTILGIGFRSELRYDWLCLGVLVVLAAATRRVRSSGLGRSMMAVRDHERQAASLGVSPARTKLVAFALSGAMAAFAGYFYGGLLITFPTSDAFQAELGLALLGMVVLGGVTSVTGAVLGAVYLKGLGYALAPVLPSLLGATVTFLVAGVGLLGAVLAFPSGIAGVVFSARDRLLARLVGPLAPARVPAPGGGDAVPARRSGEGIPTRRSGGSAPVPLGSDGSVATEPAPRARAAASEVDKARVRSGGATPGPGSAGQPALEASSIVVRFGGNVVLDEVTLEAARGEIVGLVGPNGAGKTTLFDVLSGHLAPAAGTVLLHGADVTTLPPERRARLGLGRSFQQARLFDEMALREAVAVALEREDPSEVVPSLLGLPPARRSEKKKRLRAEELLELFGLSPFGDLHAGELSTGTRRLAELAALCALGADVLLLDEPTAGIAQREVEAFRPVLLEVRDRLDATILLVEHDIPLVTSLADRVYVLDAGQVLASGPPEVLREDPRVVAAYLGTDERLVARSGAVPGGLGARAGRARGRR
jgi:ABC-type branched-subunit amino acid transport system ATPase component/ABC-type branched-subunit amino acid transport system permease subunit